MQRRTTVDVNPNIAGILSLFDPALDWSADLSGDEYESVLKEFLVVNQEGSKDPRKDNSLKGDEVEAIREEWQRVRKNKNLEYRVVKKNISAQKLLNSSKEVKAQSEGGGDLLVIKEKVVAIEALLGEQYKLQEENAKVAREEAEKKRRSLKERLLEGAGKVSTGIKKAAEAVLKPFQSIWSKILGFLETIFLGRVLYKILEWGGKKENQDKIKSIFRFMKDWWPALLASYLVFGNGLTSFAIGLIAKLGWWTAKLMGPVIKGLLAAAMKMGPWGLGALAVLGGGAAYMMTRGGDGGEETEVPSVTPRGDRTELENQKFDEMSESKGFKQGGFVSGPGGVDKVPARLTAGEFVMSKGAVQKYGVNTLSSMNAAGGGTNRPTPMGRYNEGGSVTNGATEMLINMDMLGLPGLGGGGGGTNSITDKSPYLSTGKKIKNVGNMLALPFRDRTIDRDPRSDFASDIVQGFQGGGQVKQIGDNKTGVAEKTHLIQFTKTKRVKGGKQMEATITPLPGKKPKVVVVDESSSDNFQADTPQGDNQEIPNFDAKVIRNSKKMEVLGISI